MNRIPAIVERNKEGFWIRIEGKGDFFPVGFGETIAKATKEVREAIKAYQEFRPEDKYWGKVDASAAEFVFSYDLTAFFQEYSYLNISEVARVAKINAALLRQYASGSKCASDDQTKKIEETLHQIGKKLQAVSLKRMNRRERNLI